MHRCRRNLLSQTLPINLHQQVNGTYYKRNKSNMENKFAINDVIVFLRENVIGKNEIHSLSDLYKIYTSSFKEQTLKTNVVCEPYRKDYVQQQIEKALKTNIKIIHYKKQNYICDYKLDSSEAKKILMESDENNLFSRIKRVANDLRHSILAMPIKKLPKDKLTVKHISEGECEIPPELNMLIECLLVAPNKTVNERKSNIIKAICHTIFYGATSGDIKPSTQLNLGLVMKSKTNSRSVVEILNKLGFSTSYSITEEMETELAYTNSLRETILPHGLMAGNGGLNTAVAFDNYDRFVDTSSGKETLHDTVGIVIQDTSLSADLSINDTISTINVPS